MDEYDIRANALTQAIKLAPNNETGNSAAVVEDAEKFYAFLTGQSVIPDPLPGHTYRLVPTDGASA